MVLLLLYTFLFHYNSFFIHLTFKLDNKDDLCIILCIRQKLNNLQIPSPIWLSRAIITSSH